MTATRLHVGNLNFETTVADLDSLFFAYGGRNGVVIIDRQTGRSRGYGFIDVDDDKADRAIAELNGAELLGRPLKVAVATPRNSVGRLTPRP